MSGSRRRDKDPVKAYADGRVAYWTGGVPGVGARVFERHGNEAAAEERAEELRGLLSVGIGRAPGLEATVDDLAQAALDAMRDRGEPEGTVRQYKSNWNTWIPELVGVTPCRQVSLFHWSTIFQDLGAARAPVSTVRNVARTLGAITKHGVRFGYFGTDEPWGAPAQRGSVVADAVDAALKRAGETDSEPISIEECPAWDDITAYADALEKQYPGFGSRLALLCAGTGARLGEALAWRQTDFNLESGEVRIDWQLDRYKPWPALARPKGGKPRGTILWAHLHDVAREAIDAAGDELVVDGDGTDRGLWLFPRVTHPNTDSRRKVKAQKYWLDAVGKWGGWAREDIGWAWGSHHWTRHHWATWTMASHDAGGYGIDLASVSRWLGHADPAVTMREYTQPLPNMVQVAVESTTRPPGRAT